MPHLFLYLFLAWFAGNQVNNDQLLPEETAKSVFPQDCPCDPLADTLLVTQSGDSGEGSLRCALECSGLTPGLTIIAFQLLPGQDSLILLESELPEISANTRIINSGKEIILDGSNLQQPDEHGLRIRGDSIIIKGLTLQNFPNNGIDNYHGYREILIENNVIRHNGRLSPSGDGIDFRLAVNVIIRNNTLTGNNKDGIYLQKCAQFYLVGNTISLNEKNGINVYDSQRMMLGDSSLYGGNIIIGNLEHGIRAYRDSRHLEFYNNFIGVHPDQVAPVPNGINGILISDCDTVRIGQPGAGNFITGNTSSGIKIADSSHHIALQNNSIGFSFVQGLGFPNGQNGIEVLNSYQVTIGGPSTEYANNIGFHLNNIYLGDSSRYCSVLHNSFFCSTNGIVIEPGSNDGIGPANSFEIISHHKVTGSSSANELIQLYRKIPICGTCQGNELLGSVQTNETDWVISFDSTLLEGDEVSLLRTDENGNTSVFSICKPFICEPYDMQITPVGQDHICENGTLQLTTDLGEEFIWSTGETSDTITIAEGGIYSVQVWDEKGCPSQDSILILTFAEPSLEIYPADSTVFCENYQILNASGQGKFAWNTGDSGPIIMVEESGTYCVTLTNQYNCQSVACVPITRGEEVIAEIEVPGDSVYCEGTPVLLRASGGTQYNWNTGQSGNSDSLWVTKTGLYKITVSNEYGCSDTASVSITFNPGTNSFILPGGYLSICPNDSIELTAFGGVDYLWNTGSDENHIVVDSWGDYTVTVTNEYGCSDIASQSVAVKPRIQARITEEGPVELCDGENYWLTVGYNIMDSIVWNDTLNADSIQIDAPGTYTVEVFNLGCSIRDSVEVIVWPKPARPDSITGPSWSNPDSIQYFSVFEYDPDMIYEWEVDGGLILTTAGGEVEIQWSDQDMGMICVAATDTNGCKSDLFCRMIDLAPLNNQYIEKENLLIYPNPANSLLNIEFGTYPGIRQLQLSFFHPSGQLINQRSIQLSPDEKVTTIEVSDIPGGIYWLKISGDQKLLHFERILLNR